MLPTINIAIEMAYVQGHFLITILQCNASVSRTYVSHSIPNINIYITENHINLFLNMLFIEPMDVQTYELSDRNA